MTSATRERSVLAARVQDARARRRRRAPQVRSHLPTGVPDFVGVGVQKAGTSWWYQCLTDHPLVFHPPRVPKERHFFSDPALAEVGPTDLRDRYASQFPRPPGAITGEWTPRYLYDGWPMRLLATCAPQARILVLLRDPLERCYSGLRHQLDRGRVPRQQHVDEATERSLYGQQLRDLLSTVDEERVLVQQYERCVLGPDKELARMFRFLGLPVAEVASAATEVNRSSHDGHDAVRAAYGAMLPPDGELQERFAESALDAIKGLDVDPALWPSLGVHQ